MNKQGVPEPSIIHFYHFISDKIHWCKSVFSTWVSYCSVNFEIFLPGGFSVSEWVDWKISPSLIYGLEVSLRKKCRSFLVFGLNTEIYRVNRCIQFKYRKIWTSRNSVFGHFSRSVCIRNTKLWFLWTVHITV